MTIIINIIVIIISTTTPLLLNGMQWVLRLSGVLCQMMECVEQDLLVRMKDGSDVSQKCDGDGCEDGSWARCDTDSHQRSDQPNHTLNGRDSTDVTGRL